MGDTLPLSCCLYTWVVTTVQVAFIHHAFLLFDWRRVLSYLAMQLHRACRREALCLNNAGSSGGAEIGGGGGNDWAGSSLFLSIFILGRSVSRRRHSGGFKLNRICCWWWQALLWPVATWTTLHCYTNADIFLTQSNKTKASCMVCGFHNELFQFRTYNLAVIKQSWHFALNMTKDEII